jgi:hypothetical protein
VICRVVKPSGVVTRRIRRMRVIKPSLSKSARRHHTLSTTHRQMPQPFERREDPMIFLREVHEREKDLGGRPSDDSSMPARLL